MRRLLLLAALAGCSQDPDAFTTPLASTATPGANGCMLPSWPTAPDPGIGVDLVTGRHDGDELIVEGATGAYLTATADDNKLLGTYAGDTLTVTRLGTRRITAAGGCTFRAQVAFAGTTEASSATLTGTLTYTPYAPEGDGCDATCTSIVTFAAP